MKYLHVFVLGFAVVLYCAPAVAQHGHPGGMGNSNAGGMGHGNAGNMGHGMNSTSTSGMTAHGKTMDQILTKNTTLSGKIQKLTGMTAQQACDGFKNLGQCVAAAHVSKNLDINFACLKADMTGVVTQGASCGPKAGTKSMSLGKAIQTLSPNSNSKTEANKATKQADDDINKS